MGKLYDKILDSQCLSVITGISIGCLTLTFIMTIFAGYFCQ